ncbi:hypothetical protein Tco_0462731, partial [Tanacetum coccineum]
AILSSSSLAIFSASSVAPGRDADVVVVTTTNIKIASFSNGMFRCNSLPHLLVFLADLFAFVVNLHHCQLYSLYTSLTVTYGTLCLLVTAFASFVFDAAYASEELNLQSPSFLFNIVFPYEKVSFSDCWEQSLQFRLRVSIASRSLLGAFERASPMV